MKSDMRATCPNCEALYELPAEMVARLPASLRCARCGHVWEVQPEDVAASAEIPAQKAPVPDTGPAETPAVDIIKPDGIDLPLPPGAVPEQEPEPVSTTVALLPVPEPASASPEPIEPDEAEEGLSVAAVRRQWIVSLLALVVIIVLLLVLHGPIGRAWPPILRFYQLFGLG